MSKELATQNTSRYVQALYNIGAGSSGMGDRDLLKLSKDSGYWSFGQDAEPVDEKEDVFVVNPESFREGFVAFNEKDNDIAGTENGDVADFLWQLGSAPSLDDHEYDHPLPQPKNARAKPIKYQFQLAIDLVCIEGPNKGAQLLYKNGSQGCRDMLGKLAGEIARRKEAGAEDYVPEVALYAEDYMHRSYGRIWKPKMEILAWRTMDDDVTRDAPAPAKVEDKRAAAKPAKADRKRAPEKDVEEDAPRGRGRRDERGGEVDTSDARRRAKPRNVEPEEPEYEEEGNDEEPAVMSAKNDRAEREDRPRGRGRPEPEARGGRRERPARDEEPRGRGRRGESDPEEAPRERRAAGRGRR
jgi:hypothetical protein